MDETKKIQCLFDWKTFYNKSGHKYFPGKLCFPQFFASSIIAIWMSDKNCNDFKKIYYGFVNVLPVIIKCVFGYESNILLDEAKFKSLYNFQEIEEKFILLESFLKDENSVRNYRAALMNESLKYYKMKTLDELSKYLRDRKCCKNVLEITEIPPSSHHYLLLWNYSNREPLPYYIDGPAIWGPFHWNVFHSIAENASDEDVEYLRTFLYIYGFTVPCPSCQYNFLMTIDFDNLLRKYSSDIKDLYDKVHDAVNDKIRYRYSYSPTMTSK